MLRCRLVAVCVVWAMLLAFSEMAHAQRVITYDTVSPETGSAVTCGFCAGEKFGVIFRELDPPARGLDAIDFPFTLRGVRVAVANAMVEDGVCNGSTITGTGGATLEVYAGTTLPSGSIQANPETGPWEGETLVIEAVGLPLMRSALEMAGGSRYAIELNDLQLLEPETEEPIVISAPTSYIRVVFTFGSEADRNPACETMGLESPSSFPMRDADGVIANERNFIFGSGGLGWQWNEMVGVSGDWAIRMEIRSEGGGDAGVPDAAGVDAGAIDAGTDAGGDAGSGDASATDAGDMGGGGGCNATGRSTGRSMQGIWVLLGFICLGRRRR